MDKGKSFEKRELYDINEKIRDPEVRLIGSDGQMIGVMSSREAQKRADDEELDLVKISPTAMPPVCKIMDYSRKIRPLWSLRKYVFP